MFVFLNIKNIQRLLLYPAHSSSTQALVHFYFFLWSMNDHANAQASISVMAIRRVYNGMMRYIFSKSLTILYFSFLFLQGVGLCCIAGNPRHCLRWHVLVKVFGDGWPATFLRTAVNNARIWSWYVKTTQLLRRIYVIIKIERLPYRRASCMHGTQGLTTDTAQLWTHRDTLSLRRDSKAKKEEKRKK